LVTAESNVPENSADFDKNQILEMHELLKGFQQPDASRYIWDISLTFLIHQISFWVAAFHWDEPLIFWSSAIVAAFSAYRGIHFNHEVVHQMDRLPFLHSLYNFTFGFWCKFPAYFYLSHRHHHAKTTFGTLKDPEYAHLKGKWFPALILPLILSLVVPFTVWLRFAIFPSLLMFGGSKFRLWAHRYLTSVPLQPRYARPDPSETDMHQWLIEEYLTGVYSWALMGLILEGFLPWEVLLVWGICASIIFFFNHFRAMTAHGYASFYRTQNFAQQILDTQTVEGSGPWFHLWAPLSITYHTLHHLAPNIPYHNLPAAHRHLMSVLPSDHPYRKGVFSNFHKAFWPLVKQGATSSAADS
jgi:fatty acid desaturase